MVRQKDNQPFTFADCIAACIIGLMTVALVWCLQGR
jgi:hypothetical protein